MDTPLAANIINACVAAATLLAVLVAFYSIRESRKESKEAWERAQKLALEDRQYQSRPIIVPVGEPSFQEPTKWILRTP